MEIPEALTFDDVLLEPRHSSVLATPVKGIEGRHDAVERARHRVVCRDDVPAAQGRVERVRNQGDPREVRGPEKAAH